MRAEAGSRSTKNIWGAAAIAATVSCVPFLRTFLGGQSLYFRDLAVYFLPTRRFILEGVLAGEWRHWNPFLREGEALLAPFGYLPDLLQLLKPSEFGISVSLALHIPFAAAAFALLLHELGLAPVAAAAGALIYSLGGFSLSTINLYVYAQAIAWAPLLVAAFRRAITTGSSRAVALSALSLAMIVSTTGLEVAIQASLLAALITPPNTVARFVRASACALLGAGLSAAVFLPMLHTIAGSERGAGLTTATVLHYSVHPASFAQTLVAGFHGDLSNLTGRWWGDPFFAEGFPYILSLYLGPTVLVLAAIGATLGQPLTRRLIAAVLVAGAFCLGKYAGWQIFFDLSPALRSLRYPVKAFFTIQFAAAVLASFAIHAIATGHPRRRQFAWVCLGVGALLVAAGVAFYIAPQQMTWLMTLILQGHAGPAHREFIAHFVTADAATGGSVALFSGLIILAAHRGQMAAPRAAASVVALIAADLIRAGAGLNPGVTSAFFEPSLEMTRQVDQMKASGGRAFSCDPVVSRTFALGRMARGENNEAFSLAAMRETLTPSINVPFGLKTAMSPDSSSLAPPSRSLGLELTSCAQLGLVLPKLRAAGVTRLISVEPLVDPGLRLLETAAPQAISPVAIHTYEVSGALPRFSQPVTVLSESANSLDFEVQTDTAGWLVIRDSYAEGWQATLNGHEQPVVKDADGHRQMKLAAGRNEVRMSYFPPGLTTGIAISATSALLCLLLLALNRRPPANPRIQPEA